MTPEAQRIAIAKLCPHVAKIDGAGVPVWLRNTREEFDPLNDLNAMHEAEKVLLEDEEKWANYEEKLMAVVVRTFGGYSAAYYYPHATAANRAEAFLRTLNLWKY